MAACGCARVLSGSGGVRGSAGRGRRFWVSGRNIGRDTRQSIIGVGGRISICICICIYNIAGSLLRDP